MKRFVGILLALVLVFSIACVSAQAKTNCGKAAAVKLYAMVASANLKIDQAVLHAQMTRKNDVAWLLKRVDQITSKVFAYADFIGAEVLCEYEVFYIDGQYVEIDPLHVVHV